jgi:hypothetical protein
MHACAYALTMLYARLEVSPVRSEGFDAGSLRVYLPTSDCWLTFQPSRHAPTHAATHGCMLVSINFVLHSKCALASAHFQCSRPRISSARVRAFPVLASAHFQCSRPRISSASHAGEEKQHINTSLLSFLVERARAHAHTQHKSPQRPHHPTTQPQRFELSTHTHTHTIRRDIASDTIHCTLLPRVAYAFTRPGPKQPP